VSKGLRVTVEAGKIFQTRRQSRWATALHEGARFIEQSHEVGPREKKKRAQMLARALRKLGYQLTITPIKQVAGRLAVHA